MGLLCCLRRRPESFAFEPFANGAADEPANGTLLLDAKPFKDDPHINRDTSVLDTVPARVTRSLGFPWLV